MKRIEALLVVLFAMVVNITITAQSIEVNTDDPKYCIEEGIVSENEELRKDCIYTIGKENVEEALPVLLRQLRVEKDEELRILIARIIHRFDKLEGIKELEAIAAKDESLRLRYVCKALCEDYTKRNPVAFKADASAYEEDLKNKEIEKGTKGSSAFPF